MQSAQILLCSDLALRRRTLKDGRTEVPAALPADTRLFRVPQDLVGILDRDLAAAGIAKTDPDGRTVDVHCLRHTFATLLSKAGVVPRMAQELMRHSDIRLTMNVYTHLQLADTAGAVEALPKIGM
jgi:integrase